MKKSQLIIIVILGVVLIGGAYFLGVSQGKKQGQKEASKAVEEIGTKATVPSVNPMEKVPSANPFKEVKVNPFKEGYKNPFK